jgi:hypothetical protein
LRKTLFGQAARGGAQRGEGERSQQANAAPPRWPGAGLSIPVNLFDVVTVHAVREAA